MWDAASSPTNVSEPGDLARFALPLLTVVNADTGASSEAVLHGGRHTGAACITTLITLTPYRRTPSELRSLATMCSAFILYIFYRTSKQCHYQIYVERLESLKPNVPLLALAISLLFNHIVQFSNPAPDPPAHATWCCPRPTACPHRIILVMLHTHGAVSCRGCPHCTSLITHSTWDLTRQKNLTAHPVPIPETHARPCRRPGP